MESTGKKKGARIALSIAICALLLLGVGLALFFARPKRVSAEVSVWNGALDSAGWADESTDLWGIDANAQTDGKTAAPAGYTVDTAQKKITLASAEALAYFSHEVSIDLEHKLDGYTVTLTTDVDLDNKFWMPIGSTANHAQTNADSVDNVGRFSGTFKGEVQDGDSVRAAKITNFTFDIKEVFKDATVAQFADEGRNGFKDVMLDVDGTAIKFETGDEGFGEATSFSYPLVEPFMVKFETVEDIAAYNEANGTDIPVANSVGGLIINEDIKAYYDEMRASDPDHAAEYNMLQNRLYNRLGADYRIVYKEYNKTFAEYFRANRLLYLFKSEYEDNIRDGASGDSVIYYKDPETGAIDTSTSIRVQLLTAVDAGQVMSYGFFGQTKNAVISSLRFELGETWDFSNYAIPMLDADGKDTGLKENLIVDQGAVVVGHGYLNLTLNDCWVGTPQNGGLIMGTSYSSTAYGGLVGRMYGAHCGLPSANPEDYALRPDEYYNKDSKAEFKNCKNYASFDTFDTGTLRCGGIVGYMRYHANYVFENCENYGQIQAINAGGIAGELQNGLNKVDEDGPFIITFKNCKNFGNVESVLQDELNGTNYDLVHPNLSIRSRNAGLAGGMIGNLLQIGYTEGSKLILENCENRGNIISDGVAGGMIAQLSDPYNSSIPINHKCDVKFDDCYNYGNVTADVAFTKIPVKSELLNPTYTFTKNNTSAGAIIGRIGSGTLPDGMTLYTVTYGTDESGKYLTYGEPAAKNANAYAKDKDGNYVTYEDESGNTVYQRYTRNFLNNTLLIHLTGANTGRIVSADTARGVGADCVSGGGARIFLKGSYFVDASDDAALIPNINLPEGFILWVNDEAGNGSSTRNSANGTYTNNLLNYISAITNFTNKKYHYISGREGAAEGGDFNENDFPTFEWVDDMDWATQGSATSGAKRVLRAQSNARATTADYTITYVNASGNNSTWVDNSDNTQTGTLANIAATKAKIKEWNDAGKTVDIVIPSNVASIASNAFYDSANKLEINSVTFELNANGISACQTINDSAFRNTKINEAVTIPNVRTVGNNAFRDTEIEEIEISFYVATATTASIGTSTFQGSTIGMITIGVSTSDGNLMTTWSIGTSAFQDAEIEMISAEDLVSIGTSAFKNATVEAGEFTFYVPESVTAKTATINGTAFQGATVDMLSITDSAKDGNAKTTTTVSANAFENAEIVTKLTVTDIGSASNYSFQGVEATEISLTFYVAAATTTKTVGMGTSTFKGATIGKITIADSTKDGNTKTTTTISTSAFENATITDELNINSATIGATAFLNATIKDVAKIKLHDITSIGNNAFEGCEIQEIEITYYVPSTLTTKTTAMGTASFKGATIETITIADSTKTGNTRTTLPMGANMFENAHIGTLIADGLTGIGNYAFVNSVIDEALITWYVPEAYSTKTVGIGGNNASYAVFKGATIGSLTIEDSNKDGNTKTLTYIYPNAFEDATISEELNISGATNIYANAFKNATLNGIDTIVLHDVTSLGANAFEGRVINKIEITTYALTATTVAISGSAFKDATIGEITVTNSEKAGNLKTSTTIGANTFDGATIGTKLTVTDISSVGNLAFQNIKAANAEILLTFYVVEAATTKTVGMGTTTFKGATIGKITIKDSDREGNTKTTTTVSNNAFENATITGELNISGASIGNTAFLNANIKNINKINLHDITTIGTSAFASLDIKEIEITFYVPAAVTSKAATTGATTFKDATINKITLAGSTKSGNTMTTATIGNNAFENATLPNITIGEGITNIGNTTFKGADITTLNYYTSVTTVSTTTPFANAEISTVTFKKSANARPNDAAEFAGEYAVPTNALRAAAQVTSIVIENGITVIGNYAFYGTSATVVLEIGTISLPNSLKTIGDYAFMYAGLSSFTIPASVTRVGAYAFNNNGRWGAAGVYTVDFAAGEVNADALTTISLAQDSKLEYIGNRAFQDTLFDKMVLPASVTYVGEYAFARSIATSNRLANQSEHVVEFENVGTNITNLGSRAFENARVAGKLHLGDVGDCSTAVRYADLNNETIDEFKETGEDITVVRGAIAHKLADYAFYGVTVDELTLGEGIEWIGLSAFQNAKIGNGRIVLPSTVKWIGNSAFYNTKNTDDEKIVLEFANPASLDRIGTSAFYNVNIVKLVIPANIKDCTYAAVSMLNPATNKSESVYKFTNHSSILADSAFSASSTGGTTIYDLTLNNHSFGKTIFNYAHIKTLTVNGDVLSTTGDLCNTSTQIYELKIGEDVGALVDGLFRNARIYSVSLNSGDIEGAPFEGAQIKELYLTESAMEVGGTLLNNLLVGTVILPESITSINAGVFTYSNIKTLVIPASVTKIDDFAFRATKVSNFRLAENSKLKEIGAFAFGGAAIDSYILPEGLEVIGNGAFAQVSTSVTSITLPSTLKQVGVKAFGGNTRLNTVYIPEGLSEDVVFDSPFDSGTAQNPLFIIAENAETYFRLKEGNEYFIGEGNFTYVVTVKFQDEMGNDFEELEAQQVLFGIGYSTSLVYGQWVNNSRFALPDEFYNYVWRSGDDVVSNVGNLDAIIRNSTTDTVILIGLHRVGGKYAFVARTNIVYNGTDYTDNINALLDNRFSLIGEDMDVKIIKYNQQAAENIIIKNAGTYTVSVTYEEEEDPIIFDIAIARVVTAWKEIPYVISWDYSAFDKSVNNINAVPNYIAEDLPNAAITYTVSVQGSGEAITSFTTDENGAVVEQAAIEALNNLPVLADNGNYALSVSIPETVNYTGLDDSLLFRVGVLNNTWTTSLKVMSWIEGRFNKEIKNENGETAYPIQAAATKGDVYIEVLANRTDSKGNEIVLLERTLCGSDDLTAFLSDMEVGTYIIRASVDGTSNYTGLVETFIFRVFEKPGLPWWVTLVVTLGALLVAALIIFILWKKGVFQILTEKIVVAIRTRASVDATIASVRAAKRMEEGKQSVADAKRRARIEQMREKAKAQRALPPEERAAMLEEKAKAHAARAEKSIARSEAIKAQAAKIREEASVTEEPAAEAAATETPTEE